MEEIIGLLGILAIGIIKAISKKFEDAGKQPQKPSQPLGPFGSLDPFAEGEEVITPKPEPIVPKPEPIVPKPKPVAPKPQPMAFEFVERQTKTRKPRRVEEEEKSPKEEIDPKKLVLYSEIMKPKFNE